MLLDAVPEEDEDSSTDKPLIDTRVTAEDHIEPQAEVIPSTEGIAFVHASRADQIPFFHATLKSKDLADLECGLTTQQMLPFAQTSHSAACSIMAPHLRQLRKDFSTLMHASICPQWEHMSTLLFTDSLSLNAVLLDIQNISDRCFCLQKQLHLKKSFARAKSCQLRNSLAVGSLAMTSLVMMLKACETSK